MNTAIDYLCSVSNIKKLHHMQVKAAFRRCFDLSVYQTPVPSVESQTRVIRDILVSMETHNADQRLRVFHGYVSMRYILEILRTFREDESIMEKHSDKFGKAVLRKAIELQNELQDSLISDCPVFKEISKRLVYVCEEVEELYYVLTDPLFVQIRTYSQVMVFKKELIERTCHPKRIQWWMDYEEYNDIFGVYV